MKWRSSGAEISPEFMYWICRTDSLIIPVLQNKKIPPSTFSRAKKIVTIDWNRSFIQKNLNRKVFPNVESVLMLDSSKIKNVVDHPDFRILSGFESKFINGACIHWNNELVNKEWLAAQYVEYICAMQEFYELRENELR